MRREDKKILIRIYTEIMPAPQVFLSIPDEEPREVMDRYVILSRMESFRMKMFDRLEEIDDAA